jgi:hypothetical protein
MTTFVCYSFLQIAADINWFWFIIAVVVAFAVGGVWHSALFAKQWARVFKMVCPEKITTALMVRTFLLQFVASVVFGLALFAVARMSAGIAFAVLAGFCAWQIGNLNFKIAGTKDFFTAILIDAGYTFVAGAIFILFATIG